MTLRVVASLTLVSRSADETRRLGIRLGKWLRAGDVVALYGELGAGKTTFVQGIASGMGVRVPVRSPSFTLANQYPAERGVLHHLDLFRLAGEDEVEAAGLGEFFGGDGVSVVEWAERAGALLPDERLDIEFRPGEEDDVRLLTLTGRGGRFRDLVASWESPEC